MTDTLRKSPCAEITLDNANYGGGCVIVMVYQIISPNPGLLYWWQIDIQCGLVPCVGNMK